MSAAKRIVFTLAAAALALAVLEAGSRAILAISGRIPSGPIGGGPRGSAGDLNDYQIPDPRHPGTWLLRPGVRQTLAEAIAAKERTGRTVAAAYFRSRAALLGLGPDDPVLAVNADGFRGGEIDRSHARPRIVAIGDSCTFGTFPESDTWPRALESELARRGVEVEVVNGGIEGYSPRQVLARIDDYRRLEPEITAIYLGWNALFAERPGGLATTAVIRRAGAALLPGDPRRRAAAALARPKRPDPDDPWLARLDDHVPAFIPELERIGEAMERSGSRVVILTLPGLFDGSNPTPEALAIGHLPEFTDNPHLLARLTERANEALRATARRRGWLLVDVARWSESAMIPRHEWFFDSVHLHERGQAAIGRFVAGEILSGFGQRLSRSSMISYFPRSHGSRSAFLLSNSAP